MHRRSFLSLGLALPAWGAASNSAAETQLGVAHIGGLYSFTNTDYLNEGAAEAAAIGARCLKVSFSLDTENPSPKLYPFHSEWPKMETLEDLASSPYYRALFARNFDTFVLTAFRPGRSAAYWRKGITPEDEQAETDSLAALTRYLLRTYGDMPKTFVIQNWEGDWALRGSFDPATEPAAEAIAAMTRWLAARQRGVEQARGEFPSASARVFHACEVNLVVQAMDRGKPSVTTDVLPHLSVDLASYSAWDTKDSPAQFAKALAFIASHKVPTTPFGQRGVYVGEFGLPESEASPEASLQRTRELLDIARQQRCPYAIYWQLYCNEPLCVPPKTNADYKGFWLVRPDGSRSPVCELFQKK